MKLHANTQGDNMPSPCIALCRMNPQTELCEGCFRTIDEIAQWRTAAEDVKRAIWEEIEHRRCKHACNPQILR